ncbi:MAG: anthranilate synthase component I family protein, partial [Candidatus Eremiobacteraeota bacterium]|nr:anthranilate synthase component I family protein [Candidatus Eremiobacteraeota bacterium]
DRFLADGITPIAAFAALRALRMGPALLFESAPGAGESARHSIIGLGSRGELVADEDGARLCVAGDIVRALGSDGSELLAAARELLDRLRPNGNAPSFMGAYGAAAYEFAARFERLPALPRGSDPMPDLHLIVPEVFVVFDHLSHELGIYALAPENGKSIVRKVRETLVDARIAPLEGPHGSAMMAPVAGALPYATAVQRARAAIYEGEAFQIVLAQRWEAPLTTLAFDAYRALRALNPSPYMFFLDLGWGQLFGSSPEMLVATKGREVRMRPLAGTRARAQDTAADLRHARDLRRDPKECAEHTMLVDLARNDLARVCQAGSVSVTELRAIERFSHVMHLVSEVAGVLQADRDALDAFAAAFPAGTVSGAPKIRAMELIAQLEGLRRGFYAGSVCRFGFDGTADACITLRSAHAYEGVYHCAAGAGIVADSVPEHEDAECRMKADAVVAAIAKAARKRSARGVA